MRSLGKLWAKCHNGTIDPKEWHYERRISVNGRYFLDNEIVDLKFDRGLLYNNFSIGNCISGKVDFTLRPLINMNFPTVGYITIELRVKTKNDGESDWHMFGDYRIDSVKQSDEVWTFTGYDSLSDKKADSKISHYTNPTKSKISSLSLLNMVISGWLSLDSTVGINESIKVDLWPEELKEFDEYDRVTSSNHVFQEFTRRELLSMVAQLNSGNFYINEVGKLKFVSILPKTNNPIIINNANAKRIVDGGPLNFTGMSMRYSERKNDKIFIMGNLSNSLDMYNPLANAYSATTVYQNLMKMDYRSFYISSAQIDPAIELGDRISVNGVETSLWQVTFSPRVFADIDIPNTVSQYVYDDKPDQNNECILLSGIKKDSSKWITRYSSSGELLGASYTGDAECMIVDDYPLSTSTLSSIFQDSTIKKPVLTNTNMALSLPYSFKNHIGESIDLSDFDTSNTVSMRETFANNDVDKFDFSQISLESLSDADGMFKETYGEELNLEFITPPRGRITSRRLLKNSKVEKLKLPFGLSMRGDEIFTNMSNIKELDLTNQLISPIKATRKNEDEVNRSFHGLSSLEILRIGSASYGDNSNSLNDGFYCFRFIGTNPKYIEAKNLRNQVTAGTVIIEKEGRLFTFEDIQTKLTLNISGSFTHRRVASITSQPESDAIFLPDKFNQPEKLTVICNSNNIQIIMNHYKYVYIDRKNVGSTWADHNVEFIVDPDFVWEG